jgi:hypothetical protein
VAAPTKSRYDREPASPSRSVASRATGRKRLRLAIVPTPWGNLGRDRCPPTVAAWAGTAVGSAPALLLGIEDPRSNAHAPNESLPEDDWKSLMRSLAHLFANLADLPGGRVK